MDTLVICQSRAAQNNGAAPMSQRGRLPPSDCIERTATSKEAAETVQFVSGGGWTQKVGKKAADFGI